MFPRLLAVCLAALLVTAATWRQRQAVHAPARPYLVLIVMDGFRPDYQTLAPMHHLRALMALGRTYSNAWVGQMESETPTGHATIVTGVYPRKHGVIGFGWRNPATNSFTFMPTDLRQIDAGKLTATMEAGGVPTISDLIHSRDPHDLTVSMSGEKYYAAATMGAGANYVFYGRADDWNGKSTSTKFRPVVVGSNVPPASTRYRSVYAPDSTPQLQDVFSTSLAIQLAKTLRPRALLVNLPGSDIAGHLFGGMRAPDQMRTVIRGDDWAIGRIVATYKQLGLFNNTIFVVTADHGMASNRHIVPIHPMYRTVASVAPSLDEEFRISVGSVWLRDPQKAAAVASAVATRRFNGVEGALYKVPSAGGGEFVPEPWTAAHLPHNVLTAYLDLADTEASPNGPEVIFPYREDATGLYLKGHKLWGNHGGFSWGVQHIPLLIEGPGVRPGASTFPAKLVDIAPTIERLMGLPVPARVDGVVLSDAVAGASSTERSAAQAVAAPRLRDIAALRSHSITQSS